MPKLPPTACRVALHSSACANAKIAQRTACRLQSLKTAGQPRLVSRLHALDHEWDTERLLEANASLLILLGLLLGKAKHRGWYLLSGGVSAFLLQHALLGWCPPLPLLRAIGVRTSREIEEERAQVKRLLCGPPQ